MFNQSIKDTIPACVTHQEPAFTLKKRVLASNLCGLLVTLTRLYCEHKSEPVLHTCIYDMYVTSDITTHLALLSFKRQMSRHNNKLTLNEMVWACKL